MIATMSREQLQRKLEHGGNLVLVEALPASDFEDGHLPGAVNLPPDRVRELAADVLPNKDAEIVIYCANVHCNASEKVAGELAELGYPNVRVYQGGKEDWIDAGLPLAGAVVLATPY